MSMPLLAVSSTEDAQPSPTLRLADDVAPIDPSLAFDIRPDAPPGLSNLPRAFARGGMIFANDGAALPGACVVCGDTLGLVTLPTPRGKIRFALCQEHLVSAASIAVVGLAIVGAAGFLLMRTGTGLSTLAAAVMLCGIGGGLIVWAIPVWTWRRKGEARRVIGVHADVRDSVERSGK